jgi:putative membrane protein
MTFVVAHLGNGTFAPLQLAPATISGILYALRAHHLENTSRAVPKVRQTCFYSGLALIVVTLASPLGHVSEELFLAHMAEHLLLGDIGALLLVLGLTGPMLAPVLRIKLFDRLRVLTHPLIALPLWTINLYLWHLSYFHEAAVRHSGTHAVQHLLFIVLGANSWMCLFGPLPKPAWFGNLARLVYILAIRLLGAVLANVFLWGGHAFYGVYAKGEAYWHISPAADQNAAGGIMMVEQSILTICLFAWLFIRAAREAEERQDLLELAEARGYALTEERASRAVAAGRGGDLRERIEGRSGPARQHEDVGGDDMPVGVLGEPPVEGSGDDGEQPQQPRGDSG